MNRYQLFEYRNETAYINQQLEDIETRKNRLEKITPAYKDNYGGNFSGDKIGDGVAELIDLEQEILTKIHDKLIFRKKIQEAVDNMPNSKFQRTILYSLYISENPITLVEICGRLPKTYDYKYVSKLHQKALDEFDEKYKED